MLFRITSHVVPFALLAIRCTSYATSVFVPRCCLSDFRLGHLCTLLYFRAVPDRFEITPCVCELRKCVTMRKCIRCSPASIMHTIMCTLICIGRQARLRSVRACWLECSGNVICNTTHDRKKCIDTIPSAHRAHTITHTMDPHTTCGRGSACPLASLRLNGPTDKGQQKIARECFSDGSVVRA